MKVVELFLEGTLTHSWVITIATEEPITWTVFHMISCLLPSTLNDRSESKKPTKRSGRRVVIYSLTPPQVQKLPDMTTFLSWLWSPPDSRVTGSWIPFNRPRCARPSVTSSETHRHSASLANMWHGGSHPRNCRVLNLSQSLTSSSTNIHESDGTSKTEIKGTENNLGGEGMGHF